MKLILILFNTFIMSFIYQVVLPSYELSDGGLIGLAMITNYISEINLSVIYFFMNIPILIWVFKIDKKLFQKSVVGMISFSTFTFIFEKINFEISNINPYIAIIFSGIILGFNFYSLGKIKASFGGISPIAIKLDEWGIIKMSKFYLLSDVIVLFLLLIILGPTNFLLSLLFVVIQSYSIEGYIKIEILIERKISEFIQLTTRDIIKSLNIPNNKYELAKILN